MVLFVVREFAMASARRGLPHHAAEQKVRASHVREQDGENERDYEVGRGKPPVHSRFKNGQSANPRGPRPRNLPALPRREITKCEAVPSNWSTNRPVRIRARPRC